jgi:spore germination cell wall hydrolase CwlJ-like protein
MSKQSVNKSALWLGLISAPAVAMLVWQYEPDNKVYVYGIDSHSVKSVAISKRLPEPIDCLTDNLYHEARGEGKKGMIAVANVTMNRVNAKSYANDVCSVVFQPYAFSWVSELKATRQTIVIEDEQSYLEAKKIAQKALYGGLKDITGGADHYLNPKKVKNLPKWAKEYKKTTKIGQHEFYKAVDKKDAKPVDNKKKA